MNKLQIVTIISLFCLCLSLGHLCIDVRHENRTRHFVTNYYKSFEEREELQQRILSGSDEALVDLVCFYLAFSSCSKVKLQNLANQLDGDQKRNLRATEKEFAHLRDLSNRLGLIKEQAISLF